jgi:uncharacterized membrane protein YdbT with pleckstrin-like domain
MAPDDIVYSQSDFEPHERAVIREALNDYQYQKKRRLERRRAWQAWLAIPSAAAALMALASSMFPHISEWFGRVPPK